MGQIPSLPKFAEDQKSAAVEIATQKKKKPKNQKNQKQFQPIRLFKNKIRNFTIASHLEYLEVVEGIVRRY